MTYEIAILSRQLELPHQDPADRFIAATAIDLNLLLATVDTRLNELDRTADKTIVKLFKLNRKMGA